MSRIQSFSRWGLRNLNNVYQSTGSVGSRNGLLSSLSASKSLQTEPQGQSYYTISTLKQVSTNKIISRGFASKNDQDIGEFLADEVAAEKGNLRKLELPDAGFEVQSDGAEVTFTKTSGSEKIVVSMNVNHTVDSSEPDDGTEEAPEMKSRPNFEIDIVKSNGKTLSFSCSFVPPPESSDVQAEQPTEGYDDTFAIDEVTMFDGENWNEKTYAVAGDILDGYLYDLFMNMLDERGINKQFVEKISEYCSAYEHSKYISLLEDLQKFVK